MFVSPGSLISRQTILSTFQRAGEIIKGMGKNFVYKALTGKQAPNYDLLKILAASSLVSDEIQPNLDILDYIDMKKESQQR